MKYGSKWVNIEWTMHRLINLQHCWKLVDSWSLFVQIDRNLSYIYDFGFGDRVSPSLLPYISFQISEGIFHDFQASTHMTWIFLPHLTVTSLSFLEGNIVIFCTQAPLHFWNPTWLRGCSSTVLSRPQEEWCTTSIQWWEMCRGLTWGESSDCTTWIQLTI